MAVVLGFAIDV